MRNRALLLLALAACLPGRAEDVTRTAVAPGVTLVQTIVGADEPGGPELVHMLLVNPRQRGIRLEAGLGGGTVEEPGGGMEAVTKQVARTGALAGLNADFFPFTGDPLGLAIRGGELLSEPWDGRAALGILPNGRVVMGRPHWRGTVTAADGSVFPLAGINRKIGAGEMVLIAPAYGDKTPEAAATIAALDSHRAPLRAGKSLSARVRALSDETAAVANPKEGLLLAGTAAAADWLKAHAGPGTSVTVLAEVIDDGVKWADVREAVAGGPLLLRGGQPDLRLADEHVGQDFSTTRHPRSAVGVMKDGTVMLVAVDGRQILSRGMSLPELTNWMKDHGAVDAINLDGGGSTCLSVMGLAVNCPSDGVVRRVADSLLVFGKAPPPKPAQGDARDAIRLTAGAAPVAAPGAPSGDVLWGTVNGGAFVDQRGRIYGYKGGPSLAVATSVKSGASQRWPLDVTPGPAGKMLVAWKDGALQITMRDVNNNPVAGQEVGIELPDGRRGEVTTDAKGVATVPASLLPTETSPATLVSGVITRKWPDAAK